MATPTFGIFDHIEDIPGTPTRQLFQDRLELIKMADEAGFAGFHLAEHHGSDLCMAPEPGGVHRGRLPGDDEHPARPDGEAAAAAPPGADHRGHVRRRPAHGRPPRLRRRPRRGADRALLVRQQLAGVEAALRGHPRDHLRRVRDRRDLEREQHVLRLPDRSRCRPSRSRSRSRSGTRAARSRPAATA